MRNLQELHERRAAQSHRSFYVSPSIKLQGLSNKQLQPSLHEMKAIFSKASKLENLLNPYSERRTPLLQQKSIANKLSFFQTPLPNPQKASFIINKPKHGVSFFEKREKPATKPFIDENELMKLEVMRRKDREKERMPSPMLIPEGFSYIFIKDELNVFL